MVTCNNPQNIAQHRRKNPKYSSKVICGGILSLVYAIVKCVIINFHEDHYQCCMLQYKCPMNLKLIKKIDNIQYQEYRHIFQTIVI